MSASPDGIQPGAPKWGRIVLKLSGEALAEPGRGGIDPSILHQLAAEIVEVRELGVDVAVVVEVGRRQCHWRAIGLKFR